LQRGYSEEGKKHWTGRTKRGKKRRENGSKALVNYTFHGTLQAPVRSRYLSKTNGVRRSGTREGGSLPLRVHGGGGRCFIRCFGGGGKRIIPYGQREKEGRPALELNNSISIRPTRTRMKKPRAGERLECGREKKKWRASKEGALSRLLG